MFKVAQSPTFWAKVEAEYTGEDGRPAMARFRLKFKRLPQDDIKALIERQREDSQDDRFFLRNIVEDWSDIAGDDDEPLPFTDKAFEQLMGNGFAPAMLRAYFDALPRARAKN